MKVTTTQQTILNFFKSRTYFAEVFKGKPAWLTPLIHLRILGFMPILSILLRVGFLRRRFLEIDWKIHERVLENTWVYRFLDKVPEGGLILDVGCASSKTSFELANMGYRVVGIDLRNNPLWNPNFSFVFSDACKLAFAEATFDMVLAISTVEHIGVESYELPTFAGGDKTALNEIYRCLKPGGVLYLTVPFGQGPTWYKLYNIKSLAELIKGYEMVEARYYQRHKDKFFLETSPEELEKVEASKVQGTNGVAILLCRKPK